MIYFLPLSDQILYCICIYNILQSMYIHNICDNTMYHILLILYRLGRCLYSISIYALGTHDMTWQFKLYSIFTYLAWVYQLDEKMFKAFIGIRILYTQSQHFVSWYIGLTIYIQFSIRLIINIIINNMLSLFFFWVYNIMYRCRFSDINLSSLNIYSINIQYWAYCPLNIII